MRNKRLSLIFCLTVRMRSMNAKMLDVAVEHGAFKPNCRPKLFPSTVARELVPLFGAGDCISGRLWESYIGSSKQAAVRCSV